MNTIVGYFSNRSSAEGAIANLVNRHIIEEDTAEIVDSETSTQTNGKGFMNHLKDLFGGDHYSGANSDHYAEAIRRGDVMVKFDVSGDGVADNAADSLISSGAIDVDGRAEYLNDMGFSKYDPTSLPFSADESRDYQSGYADWLKERDEHVDPQSLSVVQEELKVGKREINHGGVRIVSRITESPIEQEISLRDESIEVERHPVNRLLSDEMRLSAFQEGTIELTETDEEAVISKEARVVEEVSIQKHTKMHTETVKDKVRRQDVDVVKLDAVSVPINPLSNKNSEHAATTENVKSYSKI